MLKNKLARTTLEQGQITSVLDIGCGDIAILEGREIERYTGIDISSVVIEQNKLARPDWLFLCEDLAGTFEPEPADLVLCLDVLMHQCRTSDYKSIQSKAIGAAERTALVSGYAQRDPGWNVYFHEPIERTVRDTCPTAIINKIAEYRGTRLLKVTPMVIDPWSE
jgi:SAM-dependent methyltransferase